MSNGKVPWRFKVLHRNIDASKKRAWISLQGDNRKRKKIIWEQHTGAWNQARLKTSLFKWFKNLRSEHGWNKIICSLWSRDSASKYIKSSGNPGNMMPPHSGKAARPDRPTNSSLFFVKKLEIARILSKLMFFAYPFRMWQKLWPQKRWQNHCTNKNITSSTTPPCINCVYIDNVVCLH